MPGKHILLCIASEACCNTTVLLSSQAESIAGGLLFLRRFHVYNARGQKSVSGIRMWGSVNSEHARYCDHARF